MSYCSIEEAWGSDFAKPKKKKKKNRKKPIEDPIDPEILIPDTREFKPADVRVPNISFEDTSGIGAYDDAYDNLMSPYLSTNQDPIDDSNKKVDEYNQALVQVKSVDQNYPLIGEVIIKPEISIKEALEKNGSNYGILVENNLLNQLNLNEETKFINSILELL